VIASPQLVADLRPAFRGGLYADVATRGVYATDASPFLVTPLVVAVPKDEADVQAIVRYAGENGLSIVPRGAGTGLAGESLGPGIVLDLSVHFRAPAVISGDTVRVSPGLTLSEVNAALRPHGRRIATDVSNAVSCTIGGMIATNASGANAAVHGYLRDHVAGLRVVWDNGTVDELNGMESREERTQTILRSTADLIRDNQATIQANRPRTPFTRCGYQLHDVLTDDRLNLAKILVGSEGTLGIVTEATLRTIPLPGGTASAAIGFTSIDLAARAGTRVRTLPGIVTCDLLDRRLISLGKGLTVPAEVEAVLLLSAEADSEADAVLALQVAILAVESTPGLIVLATPTNHSSAIETFRSTAVSGLYGLGIGPRPIAVVEDVGVPPELVPDFLARLTPILRAADLSASLLVHSPTGVVHIRPLVDLHSPDHRDKLWPLADAIYAQVLELGGTISAQHGVGLSRTPWVRKQFAEAADLFREVKRIFDPKNVLNPGKIVGPDPTRPAWPLQPIRTGMRSREVVKTASDTQVSIPAISKAKPASVEETNPRILIWETTPANEAAKCNGCGDCRPRTGIERMCPVFKTTGLETATPRAKANLLRLLDNDGTTADGDAIRAVASLCVNCKMCRDECKAGVDVPKLMNETKAMLWRDHGTDRGNWFLARVESLIGTASFFTFTANTLLGTRWGRWLLARFFGLDRTLRLPSLRYRTFVWRSWTRGWTRRRKDRSVENRLPRVALYVDPLTNATDPLTGEAAVAVLKHQGAEVVVVPRSRATGLAALSAGDAETAKDHARRTVRLLADFARDGYTIVCVDPSAVVAISQEYPALLETADVTLVAESTIELMTLLGQWHEAGLLKTDFREQDLWLGHHVPCHVKALKRPIASPHLLGLIPGVHVQTIDNGCSGMAGPWGTLGRNRADSQAIGQGMTKALSGPDVIFGSSECGSCRIQMQETTGKRAVHPVQYLAMAYGLLPEVGRRLVVPLRDRVSR
jgi:FAD/FMN-containing dehydrogenase/Fe-S oxidoreductase